MRLIGLEPTRLTAPDPKSGAATNYATSARAIVTFPNYRLFLDCDAKVQIFLLNPKLLKKKYSIKNNNTIPEIIALRDII